MKNGMTKHFVTASESQEAHFIWTNFQEIVRPGLHVSNMFWPWKHPLSITHGLARSKCPTHSPFWSCSVCEGNVKRVNKNMKDKREKKRQTTEVST